ncbi:MAG: hypothetical protein U9O98_01185 [Asgard group archaeon]|nr:hypothetical protein [Asgard group archaeon]
MSNQKNPINRLNKWFIRLIGILTAALVFFVLFITLPSLTSVFFPIYNNTAQLSPHVFLEKNVSEVFWQLRVYDILFLIILLLISLMGLLFIHRLKPKSSRNALKETEEK